MGDTKRSFYDYARAAPSLTTFDCIICRGFNNTLGLTCQECNNKLPKQSSAPQTNLQDDSVPVTTTQHLNLVATAAVDSYGAILGCTCHSCEELREIQVDSRGNVAAAQAAVRDSAASPAPVQSTVGPMSSSKSCECGADKTGQGGHSTWCPKFS